MNQPDSGRRWLLTLVALLVAANGLYWWGAAQAPLLSEKMAARQDFVTAHAYLGRAEVRAKAYWARYPDVARDAFFGTDGAQGIFGPFVHYERHGKEEGRKWGP